MPTYEYECPKCGTQFEEFQKMSAKPVAKCPKCGARATRLMSGGAGLVFKGSGFYLTDYGRAGQKARGDGESAASEKAEARSEQKVEPAGDSKSKGESDSKAAAKPEQKPAKHKKKAD